MRTVILATAIRILLPVFLVFSFYLFFRGHDKPGGGFIAGLVTSIGFIFHMIAFGKKKTKDTYNIQTFKLMGFGLAFTLLAATISLFSGGGFFEALWLESKFPFIGKLGTPILFDFGIYLVVVGAILRAVFILFEE